MDKPENSNLKDSKKLKPIIPFEDKHLVIIDKSIIQKLGINDNVTTFVEQEITQDNAILQTPIEDYRKLVLWKILCPYLINVRKLSSNESTQILRDWLNKCNSLRKLDFDPNEKIRDNLKHVGNFYPIGIQKLKIDTNYKKLNILLFKKDKEINYEKYEEPNVINDNDDNDKG